MTVGGERITLDVPSDRWCAVDYPGTAALAVETPVDTHFATNVNVVCVEDCGVLDLRALVAQSIDALPLALTDFALLLDDRGRGRLVYTFRQGVESLTGMQRHCLLRSMHWVVTATTRSAEYPQRADELDRILDSFQLEDLGGCEAGVT